MYLLKLPVLIVRRLYIESGILLGSEWDSFRTYNRCTFRGIALIDRFTPWDRSEANLVDAKNINEPILTHHCEMAWWNWKTCGCPQSSESREQRWTSSLKTGQSDFKGSSDCVSKRDHPKFALVTFLYKKCAFQGGKLSTTLVVYPKQNHWRNIDLAFTVPKNFGRDLIFCKFTSLVNLFPDRFNFGNITCIFKIFYTRNCPCFFCFRRTSNLRFFRFWGSAQIWPIPQQMHPYVVHTFISFQTLHM